MIANDNNNPITNDSNKPLTNVAKNNRNDV